MSKTYTAQQFEIIFYEAMAKWVGGGKVGPDPRGEWEYQIHSGSWHEPFAPVMPEWTLHAYRWKPAKKRTVVIDGVEIVAPEVDAPAIGAEYFIEVWDEPRRYFWNGLKDEQEVLTNGKIFLTHEDCQAMVDAQRKQRLGGVV